MFNLIDRIYEKHPIMWQVFITTVLLSIMGVVLWGIVKTTLGG